MAIYDKSPYSWPLEFCVHGCKHVSEEGEQIMEYDREDQEERIAKLGDLAMKRCDCKCESRRNHAQDVTDRACRLGLPEGMSLVDFEDYIRSLYPEFYVYRKKGS